MSEAEKAAGGTVEASQSPDDLEVVEEADALAVVRKWPRSRGLVVSAAAAACFAVAIWLMKVGGGKSGADVYIGAVVLAVASPILLYAGGAYFVNSTTMRVEAGVVSVDSGPIPWPGEVKVEVDQIEELYCEAGESSSEDGEPAFFHVVAELVEGEQVELFLCGDREAARYVERKFEEYCAMRDRSTGRGGP